MVHIEEKEKMEFYNAVLSDVVKGDSEEVLSLIRDDANDNGFYELCQSYVDVALNAKKFNDEKTGKLAGVFTHEDIGLAVEHTVRYVRRHSIKNVDALFNMIQTRYRQSISKNEERQKSAFVQNDKAKEYGKGVMGTLYDFRSISVWDEIKKELLRKLAE